MTRPPLWKQLLGLPSAILRHRRNKQAFQARPDDIFIVTYPKSGTTWMQNILYQLKGDGAMDFEHIWDISPTLEAFYRYGKPDIEAMAGPRLIKSHANYKQIPKAESRYIYVSRDGRDVAVSLYHQSQTLGVKTGSFQAFFKGFLMGRIPGGNWFGHVRDWQANADSLNVLYLTYEELKQDPEAAIGKVAEFCGFQLDEQRLQRTLERTSFAYMKEHEDKFRPRLRDMKGNPIGDQSPPGQFVRKGKAGGWQEYFDEDMKKAWKQEHAKWFGEDGPAVGESP